MICPKCGCRVELGMKKCPVCDSTLDNEYTRYEKKMKRNAKFMKNVATRSLNLT